MWLADPGPDITVDNQEEKKLVQDSAAELRSRLKTETGSDSKKCGSIFGLSATYFCFKYI